MLLYMFFALADQYSSDTFFGQIWSEVQAHVCSDYMLQEGFFFRDNKLCIPEKSWLLGIIQELHNEGQVGRDHTHQLVLESYYWPLLRRDVARFWNDVLSTKLRKGMLQMAGYTCPFRYLRNYWLILVWISFLVFLALNAAMIPSLLSSTASLKWLILFRSRRQYMQLKLHNFSFKKSIAYTVYHYPLS